MSHTYRVGEEAVYTEPETGMEYDVVIRENSPDRPDNRIRMHILSLDLRVSLPKKNLRPKVKIKTGLTAFLEKHEEKSDV